MEVDEVWQVIDEQRTDLRAGFNFNRMVDRTARAQAAALTNEEIIACIGSCVGSRKHAFATTHVEPLLDILVHGQDIARPLGIARPMPVEAAVDWRRGAGKEVAGPISEILVAITGRPAGRVALTGLSV